MDCSADQKNKKKKNIMYNIIYIFLCFEVNKYLLSLPVKTILISLHFSTKETAPTLVHLTAPPQRTGRHIKYKALFCNTAFYIMYYTMCIEGIFCLLSVEK
jgi:hypothetical protein